MRGFLLSSLLCAISAAPVCAEEISIAGPDGPLAAEALSVDGAEDVVVIIPGTGPLDRDGNGPQMNAHTDLYKLLAEALAAEGIASLRIDKRGFFASEAAVAAPEDVTIAGYVEDARGWVRRASEMASCVWLAGHSEGGLVALLAAETAPEPLCGLILLAAPGRDLKEILLEQLEASPWTAPYMDFYRDFYADLAAGTPRDPASFTPQLAQIYSEGQQRFLIDLFAQDPVAAAKQWAGPVLIVQGDADLNVKPVDADALAAAMPQAVRADLDGATHMLKPDVPGDPFATYTDPSHPLHPGLLPAVTQFIADHEN